MKNIYLYQVNVDQGLRDSYYQKICDRSTWNHDVILRPELWFSFHGHHNRQIKYNCEGKWGRVDNQNVDQSCINFRRQNCTWFSSERTGQISHRLSTACEEESIKSIASIQYLPILGLIITFNATSKQARRGLTHFITLPLILLSRVDSEILFDFL